MKLIAKSISLFALSATILPSFFYFSGAIGHDTLKWTALVGTLIWFIVTPFWMGSPAEHSHEEVNS
jgi:hypothetical protein